MSLIAEPTLPKAFAPVAKAPITFEDSPAIDAILDPSLTVSAAVSAPLTILDPSLTVSAAASAAFTAVAAASPSFNNLEFLIFSNASSAYFKTLGTPFNTSGTDFNNVEKGFIASGINAPKAPAINGSKAGKSDIQSKPSFLSLVTKFNRFNSSIIISVLFEILTICRFISTFLSSRDKKSINCCLLLIIDLSPFAVFSMSLNILAKNDSSRLFSEPEDLLVFSDLDSDLGSDSDELSFIFCLPETLSCFTGSFSVF